MLRALVGAIEPRLVFFPTRGEQETPASHGIDYRAVHVQTADGERLAAWQLEPESPIADVVYFHGNGGNLSIWLPIFANLHAIGLRVLAVDYRGYGTSTGSPSEEGLYRDAEAVARHAMTDRERSGSTLPLVFWGRSLGGPVAAAATRVVLPDGLILESTFVDKAAVVATSPVLRVLNVLARYRFSTLELLEGFRNPVLVMHADRDSIVPYALGRDLFERLRPPKRFVAIVGADHNDLVELTRDAYWEPVREFIASLASGSRPADRAPPLP